jgi:D-sedoheptulose 7-phosphate isomerase
MSRAEHLRTTIAETIEVLSSLCDDDVDETFERAVEMVVGSLRRGGKVLLCGNGGSAADAQHLAAEFVGRFTLEREALGAVALSDNGAAVTAVANDYGYDEVFARAVAALAREHDVLIGMSTSGRSRSVVRALEVARGLGVATIALVGLPESAVQRAADVAFTVHSGSTARVQEAHIVLGHSLFEIVEQELCRG